LAKGAKTAATHPGEEKLFINKARRFLEGARELLKQNNHEGAAVLAVHSTISSCDALTAKFLSCRHKGENHATVVNLLKTLPLKDVTELDTKIKQITEILTKKTQAEYESKPIRKDGVETMVAQASRIYRWAKGLVR